jgi:hypothetical protein
MEKGADYCLKPIILVLVHDYTMESRRDQLVAIRE